jgi:hypothetical protein
MNYRNAHYINAIGWIDCEINHPVYSWIPYTLVPSDTDMTVNNDDLLAAMDAAGDVSAYVSPTDEEFAATVASQVREERNMRLATDVDIIAGNTLRWGSLTEEKQSEWETYRLALLDVPSQDNFPHNVAWPIKPE